MRDTLLFLFLFASSYASTSTYSHATEWNITASHGVEPRSFGLTGRIVNGTKAALNQFPHQVSLRRSYSGSHFCGGAILKEYIIITAAHCMYNRGSRIQPWTIVVVAGELELMPDKKTGQERGVSNIYIHPNFNYNTLENDIALLVLSVPLNYTKRIQNVTLPSHSYKPGTVCQVSGWGYPSESHKQVMNNLMYVDLPIINRTMCKELLKNLTNLPQGMYCAGYVEGQKDACQGDSGGAMICNGVLTGVVSGGEGCARPRLPGVYSDVFYYRWWLSKFMTKPHMALRSSSANRTASFMLTLISICSLALLSLFRH